MLMRLMSKGEYLIVPKGTKFMGLGKLGLRWRYVVLSIDQSRNNYVINVCLTYNTYLLMTWWLLLHRKNNISALWWTWGIIMLGQVVALLLSLCMTKMTAQMATRLTLGSFKCGNRKVSIATKTWLESRELLIFFLTLLAWVGCRQFTKKITFYKSISGYFCYMLSSFEDKKRGK